MPFDVDEFIADLEPRTAEARVLRVRVDLRERHAALEAELKAALETDARENREPLAPQLAEQLAELEAEIEQAETVVFRFRSIGTRKWLDLLAEHPPTKDQLRQKQGLDHNPLTFPVAAVAASSDEPKLTVAQARALESNLDLSEWEKIWQATLAANLGGDGSPKSVLAGTILRLRERSATTAASEESLDPSSSDES